MGLKKHLPNLVTLGNLACGIMGILILGLNDLGQIPETSTSWIVAVFMVFAMVFDFLDGFVARLLKVSSELGAQLDSLADLVTFGVLPGIFVFQMIGTGLSFAPFPPQTDSINRFLPYLAFLIPLASAYRLAKFNIDTRERDYFFGLATPANAFFFLSIFLIFSEQLNAGPNGWQILLHPYGLSLLVITFSCLLLSNWPLLSFKFKDFSLTDNLARYLFLGISLILLLLGGHYGVPFIMVAYFLLSFIDHRFLSKNS